MRMIAALAGMRYGLRCCKCGACSSSGLACQHHTKTLWAQCCEQRMRPAVPMPASSLSWAIRLVSECVSVRSPALMQLMGSCDGAMMVRPRNRRGAGQDRGSKGWCDRRLLLWARTADDAVRSISGPREVVAFTSDHTL